MKLVFIYGPPAVGKLTVANELSSLTGIKVFDNHKSLDLALEFFDFHSEPGARICNAIRMAVFETTAMYDLDLIFTYVYARDADDPWVKEVLDVAEGNGGEVCFVQLTCSQPVLEERVVATDRLGSQKLTSVGALREVLGKWDLFSPIPFGEQLSVDTGVTTPKEAARIIAEHYTLGNLGKRSEGTDGM